MRVLIACEFSGVVRTAFEKMGHEALSCDMLPTEIPGNHYQGDVMDILADGWDLMIAHPPCTYLAVSGNKWMKPEFEHRFPGRQQKRESAIEFFMKFVNAPCDKIAIENPVGIMSSIHRKPDQIIHPYYFGDEARKATCLWLKGIPLLQHQKYSDWFGEKTHVGQGEILYLKSGKTMPKWYASATAHVRSKTFQGIADAMANQWGTDGD